MVVPFNYFTTTQDTSTQLNKILGHNSKHPSQHKSVSGSTVSLTVIATVIGMVFMNFEVCQILRRFGLQRPQNLAQRRPPRGAPRPPAVVRGPDGAIPLQNMSGVARNNNTSRNTQTAQQANDSDPAGMGDYPLTPTPTKTSEERIREQEGRHTGTNSESLDVRETLRNGGNDTNEDIGRTERFPSL